MGDLRMGKDGNLNAFWIMDLITNPRLFELIYERHCSINNLFQPVGHVRDDLRFSSKLYWQMF